MPVFRTYFASPTQNTDRTSNRPPCSSGQDDDVNLGVAAFEANDARMDDDVDDEEDARSFSAWMSLRGLADA
jgi:hypothetical protein